MQKRGHVSPLVSAVREEIASRLLQLERNLADGHAKVLQLACDSREREEAQHQAALAEVRLRSHLHSPEALSVLMPSAAPPPPVEPPELHSEQASSKHPVPLCHDAKVITFCVRDQTDEASDHSSKGASINPPLEKRKESKGSSQSDDEACEIKPYGARSKTQIVKNDFRDQIRRLSEDRFAEKARDKNRSTFIKSKSFAMFVSGIILTNIVYLGVQAQIQIRDEFQRLHGNDVFAKEFIWQLCDVCFIVLFTSEMCLRIWHDGSHFVSGREKIWNMFDLTVVSTSVVELILDFTGVRLPVAVSLLRTLRVLRIIRLLRIGKVFGPVRAVFQHLQCILLALAGSAESFIAAILMFLIVLYIFGLTFMQGVTSYLVHPDTPDDHAATDSVYLLELHYGSLEKTVWTLVSAVTGGVDWNDVCAPLEVTYGYYKYYFLFYVLFMIMCLLNVLTGIFVNVAMQATSMNREIAIDEAIRNRDSICKEVVELFLEADVDASGGLSFAEFEDFMQDEKIKAFFIALELDMSSCSRIFHLLDENGDGTLEAHEFVEGCIELRGYARKVDFTLLQRENKAVLDKLENIASDLSTEIKEVVTSIAKTKTTDVVQSRSRDEGSQNRYELRKGQENTLVDAQKNHVKFYKSGKDHGNRLPGQAHSAVDEESEIDEMYRHDRKLF
jgi:hypothetical protein